MRENLILPLIFVIGILMFSSVASANLWEKLGLKRISGAPIAWNTGNPTEMELTLSKPKANTEYTVGQDVFMVARGKKDGGYLKTLKYSIYLDGAAVLSSQEIRADGNAFVLTYKFPSEQLTAGEHKVGMSVCGWYKEECIGEKVVSTYINVKAKETKECPAVPEDIAYGQYELPIGASINVGGAKITVMSVGMESANIKVSKA